MTGGRGGALYADNSTVVINGGSFDNNMAVGDGGAIFADASAVTLDGVIVDQNQATTLTGGGLSATNASDITVNECEITSNSAPTWRRHVRHGRHGVRHAQPLSRQPGKRQRRGAQCKCPDGRRDRWQYALPQRVGVDRRHDGVVVGHRDLQQHLCEHDRDGAGSGRFSPAPPTPTTSCRATRPITRARRRAWAPWRAIRCSWIPAWATSTSA